MIYEGYTILEVLIVLLLLAILSSLTLSNVTQLITKTAAQQDCEQLLNAIHFARTQALLLQGETLLCPTDTTKQCGKNWQLGFTLWHCIENQCQLLRQFSLFDTKAQLVSTRPSLRFNAKGLSPGSNLRLSYRSSHFSREFIINNEGRVRME